jgi:hypothetical protein
MTESRTDSRLFDWLWFFTWAVGSSIWCWTAARNLGATFDEPVYVARGLECWRTGSHHGLMQLGTMPLPVDLDTLPLYVWERWHGIQLDPEADLPRLLPWARAGTLVFWWLLLVYARLSGRQLAGPWGGRLAVAMLAFEPSMLAHASLATTDIAVTTCLLALVYHFRQGREAGWFWRVGVPTFWFAACALAKASGLIFGILCLLVVELERLLRQKHQGSLRTVFWTFFSTLRWDLLQIGIGGLLLTFLYCGSDWRPEPSFVKWAHELPAGPGSQAMVWLADHLCIFSNAGEGLVRQVKHNVRGHGTYLLGQVATRSIWYYFPVVLTIKLSLPLLILPLGLLLIRPRALLNWAFLAALALLAFSITYRVQIGIRLVLPLVALAAIGLAAAAVQACRSVHVRVILGVGVVWTALAAILVWPEALCYTNELWGGTKQGYLLLSDSNYDWGQGLCELERWRQKHTQDPLDVWYFGTDPALRMLPMKETRLQAMALYGPGDVLARLRGHYLAVSTTVLHGSIQTLMLAGSPEARSYEQAVALLRTRQPIDRTTTFLIYDFRQEGAEAGHARVQK